MDGPMVVCKWTDGADDTLITHRLTHTDAIVYDRYGNALMKSTPMGNCADEEYPDGEYIVSRDKLNQSPAQVIS